MDYLVGHVVPFEYEVPVEAASKLVGGADVAEVIHVDHVDDRTHHYKCESMVKHERHDYIEQMLCR